VHDAHDRQSSATKIAQRQGHSQRHSRHQYKFGRPDYARTPSERRRAMASVV
jgi:hypothetical protein